MCVCVSRGGGVCVSKGGVLGDLLPWPIKWGFAFDSVLKETDEPAELHDFLLECHFLFPPPQPTPILSSYQTRILLCSKGSESIFTALHALTLASPPGFRHRMWCVYSLA